jgi:hypothetical protein
VNGMEELERLLTVKLNLNLNIKLLKEEMNKWLEFNMDHVTLFDEMIYRMDVLKDLYKVNDTKIVAIISKMSAKELYVAINKTILTIE